MLEVSFYLPFQMPALKSIQADHDLQVKDCSSQSGPALCIS